MEVHILSIVTGALGVVAGGTMEAGTTKTWEAVAEKPPKSLVGCSFCWLASLDCMEISVLHFPAARFALAN
jgi:hypothetical protein